MTRFESMPAAAIAVIALIGVSVPTSRSAAAEVTSESFMRFYEVTAEHRAALDRGELVTYFMRDALAKDVTEADLLASMALVVDQPYEIVVSVLEDASVAKLQPATIMELTTADEFPAVEFGSRDDKETLRILRYTKGRDVNIDAETLKQLKGLGIDSPLDDTERARFSRAYGTMLRHRYEAYRDKGLAGIAPYTRGGSKEMSPAEHLRITTETALDGAKDLLPTFVGFVRSYPETSTGEHRFLLVRQLYDERPLYMLVHLLAEKGDGYLVLMHREYFVSHSYDANQMWLVCAKYGNDRTLVTLSSDAITDEVAGFASGLKHKVGRSRVRSAAEPFLLDVKRRAGIAAAGK